MFMNCISQVWRHLSGNGSRRAKRAKLRLERLEPREVPAAWLWVRTATTGDDTWGNHENWKKDGVQPPAGQQPGQDDDVTFDGANSSNTTSTVGATTTIKSFTITTGYAGATAIITLSSQLTIKNSASLSGTFTITGGSDLQIGTGTAAATFSIDGGNFSTAGAGKVIAKSQVTGTLTGTNHNFDKRNLENYGVISWNGGDVYLSNGATVDNSGGATINVTNGNAPTFFGGVNGFVLNDFGASFNVVVPGAATPLQFQCQFNNHGTMAIASGQVTLFYDTSHAGVITVETGMELHFTGPGGSPPYFPTHLFYTQAGGSPSRISGGKVFFHNDTYISLQGNLDLVDVTTDDWAFELIGAGTLTIDRGTFNWFKGDWVGGGAIQVGRSTDTTSSATLNIADYAGSTPSQKNRPSPRKLWYGQLDAAQGFETNSGRQDH